MLRQNFGLLLGHQYAGHRMSEIGHSRRSRSNLRMTQFSLEQSRGLPLRQPFHGQTLPIRASGVANLNQPDDQFNRNRP